ncbi:hypothetical protein TKK_0014121 [Trichogramma kaykai]|uniref:PWWP domain-containing protein n=2 Tax=Trichogramma kaykai TaxID=54128 RepID=A0ABD2WG11_9HYME
MAAAAAAVTDDTITTQQPAKKDDVDDLAPGHKILVQVDSVLPDILVVSYLRNGKTFQGALLDATKRGLPCGIQPPEPIPDPDGDKLSTIAARFSYFQEKRHTALSKIEIKRHTSAPGKGKGTRPTVRLRPRQVLCTKCSSICNEKSENVGRKRKHEDATSTAMTATATTTTPQVQQPRRSDRRCTSQQRLAQQQQQRPITPHGQNTRSQQRLLQNSEKTNQNAAVATPSSASRFDASQYDGSGQSAIGPVLIPKMPKLHPNEISAMKNKCARTRSQYWTDRAEEAVNEASGQEGNQASSQAAEPVAIDSNPTQAYCATPRRLSSSSVESAKIPVNEEDKKTFAAADSTVKSSGGRTGRVTRKKRGIGSMEDLWDESVFEDAGRTSTTTTVTVAPATATTTTTKTTPVIKICFGTQGEGTVVKIPAKIQNPYPDTDTEEAKIEPKLPLSGYALAENRLGAKNGDGGESQDSIDLVKQSPSGKDSETATSKAAKKALKKAMRKAQKKMYSASPLRSPINGSPRYTANFLSTDLYHRRKHKVKHKKKHKEERKHKQQQKQLVDDEKVGSTQQPQQPQLQQLTDCHVDHQAQQRQEHPNLVVNDEDAKEQCLKQKLSISLKRLTTNAYAPLGSDLQSSYPISNASSGCKSPGASSDEDEEVVDEVAAETAPVFPAAEHSLVMRLSAAATTTVGFCFTNAGKRMDVGDIVWGKVTGFPWWPGKVLSITDSRKDDGTSTGPQAHVAWYGSTTSSLMSCDQLSPFLETFKTRYNKKKKGPYKEAIKQAQSEARSQIASVPSIAPGSVLDVCGSPREVNVLS